MHGLSITLLFLPLNGLAILPSILLQGHSLLERLFSFLLSFVLLLLESTLIFLAVVVQFILMVLHCFDL